MVPPTNRKRCDFVVGKSMAGTPGWKRAGSTPLGMTTILSGLTPLREKLSLTWELGTHTSSTIRFSGSTQADGMLPYSQG